MSTIAQIMTKTLKTIPWDSTVANAAQHMRDSRISALLIQKNKEFVGILTDTDIVRRCAAEGKDITKILAENIMTTPIAGIETTRSVRDAHDMMGDLGVRHLVARDAGKIVGIVSVRDLLTFYKSYSEPKITQD